MIQKTLKTVGGKLTIRMPTLLNEITLCQLMKLQETPNLGDLEAISILAGIPLEEMQNVLDINDFDLFLDIILSLSNQIRNLYNSEAMPAEVNFYSDKQTVRVKVVNYLNIEPCGAFMAARDVITADINEHIERYGENNWKKGYNPSLEACCQVLAHYFFCRATRKRYNEHEAEEFTAEIKKLRVTEALPIAKHFFTCYPNLSKQKTSFWLLFRLNWSERLGLNRLRSLAT